MDRRPSFTVHHSEPTYCPKCKHPLKEDEKDYHWIMGWINENREKRHHRCRFIQCTTCHNETYQAIEEEWHVMNKKDADALVATGEYWNLREGSSSGNMAKDYRTIHDISGMKTYYQTPLFDAKDGSLLASDTDTNRQKTMRMMREIFGSRHNVSAVQDPTPEEIAHADRLRNEQNVNTR